MPKKTKKNQKKPKKPNAKFEFLGQRLVFFGFFWVFLGFFGFFWIFLVFFGFFRFSKKMLGTFFDEVLILCSFPTTVQTSYCISKCNTTRNNTNPIYSCNHPIFFDAILYTVQKDNAVKYKMMMIAETISFKFYYSL